MSKSGRQKEKYGKGSGLSLDNCHEGTAARTRPFSFEEIMVRREKKKFSENAKVEAVDIENKSREDIVENITDRFEPERGHRQDKDSSYGFEKHVSDEFVKVSSWKKDENTSVKEHNLAKGKDRDNHDSKTKSKSKQYNDTSKSNKAKADKFDKQDSERRAYRERTSDDSENKAKRKHSRDGKDRYADNSRGKSERENKRKYRNGENEKTRGRNAAKKLDLGKRKDLEIPVKRERKESSKYHYEESKPKRRRSRSRELEDRSRRSISVSPRAHKHTSYHGQEHGDLPSHSFKDRSGRQHSDVDRNRISSNGSSSHYLRHVGSTSRLGGYSPRKRKTEVAIKTPSSHYQRHGVSKSRLGGYSPRKRKNEAAIKTPSPPNRSPEKKSAGWDLPHTRKETSFSDPISSNFPSSNQTTSSNVNELVTAVPVVSSTVKPISGVSFDALSTRRNAPVDPIQLTQATRPRRRLYVENIPASASEKAMMECLNKFLLSSGGNHIEGTQPCISCIIHREKSQALLEFLTPADASSALSFDGSSFSGSILKIRRPKEFIEVATGDIGKSVATVDTTSDGAVDAISDIVKDSPHKIFIGGISKSLSSEMIMEIARAFGTLKAYHFEVNEDLKEPCAFVEYVDQSITLKACAGLNGMKLGGKVLTVVQAVPYSSSSENTGSQPFYGIPEQAKSLLKQPTQVLKLKDVFNPESLSSLSELEVEEVLEDVRLECARFGSIKSVNVVKYADSCIPTSEACEILDNKGSAGTWQNFGNGNRDSRTETTEEVIDHESRGISDTGILSIVKEIGEVDKVTEVNCISDDKPADDFKEDKPFQPGELDSNMAVEDLTCENVPDISSQIPNHLNTLKDQPECHDEEVANIVQTSDDLTSEEDSKLGEAFAGSESDIIIKGNNKEQDFNLEHVFEPGCVFVEYGRKEASRMAAHCLHQRLFADRILTVEYVALDIYRVRFPE